MADRLGPSTAHRRCKHCNDGLEACDFKCPQQLTLPGIVKANLEAHAKLTGGSSGYYKARIENPTSGGPAYMAECNDIIEALRMTFAEGNAFKAIWRVAAGRLGNGKPGNTALYDAEKTEFFGGRMVAMEKARLGQ